MGLELDGIVEFRHPWLANFGAEFFLALDGGTSKYSSFFLLIFFILHLIIHLENISKISKFPYRSIINLLQSKSTYLIQEVLARFLPHFVKTPDILDGPWPVVFAPVAAYKNGQNDYSEDSWKEEDEVNFLIHYSINYILVE